MTDTHPITPPPGLVQQWIQEATGPDYEQRIATQAARWGSDQELEACCEWLEDHDCEDPQEAAKRLRAARRPKPPSLKEQALAVLDHTPKGWGLAEVDLDIIRRALEQLD